MMDVKIGQTVWLFDVNSRVYEAGHSGPVYSKHFTAYEIVGETRTSWLLGRSQYKINKATGCVRQPSPGGFYGLSEKVFWSQAEVDDACYVQEHRYRIVRSVESCFDAKRLRAIDEIMKA